MVFSPGEQSQAVIVPCRAAVATIEDLAAEAVALWQAEDEKPTAGPIFKKWGSVGAIFSDAQTGGALRVHWSAYFKKVGAPPISLIDSDGILNIDWPLSRDGSAIEFDVLLATDTIPEPQRPTPAEVAHAWINKGNEHYFLYNVERGIRTHADLAIWKCIQAAAPDWLSRPEYAAAIEQMKSESMTETRISAEELKKRMERHYVQATMKLLGEAWTIEEERESPDFIINHDGERFGLEVSSVFVGPAQNGGSVMKHAESERQLLVRSLQIEYEKDHPEPLIVKLVGSLDQLNLDVILPRIRDLEMGQREPGHQEHFDIDEAEAMLSVYVTRALRPEWYYVDDRVGYVNKTPNWIIADRIDNKVRKINRYRTSTGLSDVRLLVVADRILNSGKLVLEGPVPFEHGGFNKVYFLSYPESAQIVETSVKKLTLSEQLTLAAETAVSARAFYEIWWLYKNDETRPIIIEMMRRFNEFFKADHRAQFYVLILHLSALFDKDGRSASIVNLLRLSQAAKADEGKLKEARVLYEKNQELGRRLFVLRNRVFAHLSADIAEREVFEIAGITPDDLGGMANDCIRICNKLLVANGLKEMLANIYVLPHTRELFRELGAPLDT